jgi:DNA topoisomerase VI subunit A
MIRGDLKFTTNGGQIVECKQHNEGLLIPQGDLSEFTSDTAKFVIVVEKGSMFQQLCQSQIFKSNAIILTGRGNPDFTVRYNLFMLNDKHTYVK